MSRADCTPMPADFVQQDEGSTIPDLCQRYGVGSSTVKRWRIEAGSRRRVAITPAEIEQIKAMLAEGLTHRAIGERIGRTRKVIMNVVHRHLERADWMRGRREAT